MILIYKSVWGLLMYTSIQIHFTQKRNPKFELFVFLSRNIVASTVSGKPKPEGTERMWWKIELSLRWTAGLRLQEDSFKHLLSICQRGRGGCMCCSTSRTSPQTSGKVVLELGHGAIKGGGAAAAAGGPTVQACEVDTWGGGGSSVCYSCSFQNS